MKYMYKKCFFILILLCNRNVLTSNLSSLLTGSVRLLKEKSVDFVSSVVKVKKNNNQDVSVLNSNEFIDLDQEFERNLIELMALQSENDSLIKPFEEQIDKIDKEELDFLQNLANENNVSDQNLEELFKRKNELRNLIKDLQIMPFFRIEGVNNFPPVFQIYHTKELDLTNNASIACGPYAVAFLCAMNEIVVNDQNLVISKQILEQYTQDFFHPTDETLDETQMIERINNVGKYLFYIINYNTGKKFDKEFYDIKETKHGEFQGIYREKQVEFKNNKERLSYRTTDYDDHTTFDDVNIPEKELKKRVKKSIKNNVKNNELVHFMVRIGEDRGHGHWFYMNYVPEYHPQAGIYYINNANGFSEETKFVAENLQKLVYKALNQ